MRRKKPSGDSMVSFYLVKSCSYGAGIIRRAFCRGTTRYLTTRGMNVPPSAAAHAATFLILSGVWRRSAACLNQRERRQNASRIDDDALRIWYWEN